MITRMDGLRSWRGGKLHVHAHVSALTLHRRGVLHSMTTKGFEQTRED
jgi:hypothetical protein